MTHQVFISYAADDKSIADAVCAALERRQIRCWIAPRDARPGLDYADSIVDALDETSVMVFVISSRSVVSPHVKREVEHAANRGASVIPFRIEDVQLSRGLRYFLGTVHWIDALTRPIDTHLDYLVETVQFFLDRRRAAETPDEVSPAAPVDPASRSVASPSIPPRDDLAQAAPVEESPTAGLPDVAPPTAPARTPELPAVAPPAARAETPSLPARPLASAPVRTILPRVTTVPGTRPSEEVTEAGETISDARSSAAAPVEGPVAEGLPGSRLEPGNPLWQVVRFGAIGAGLGGTLGFGMATVVNGADRDWFVYVIEFAFMTVVPAGIVTWGWLYSVRQRTLPPAALGGLGGCLGGALSAASVLFLVRDAFPSSFMISHALQWAAFGIAGGYAASRSQSARPAVSMSIALVSVFFVRTLCLALQHRGRDYVFLLLLDLPTAIGWGIGLIACPATTAALRPPQQPGEAPAAGGATTSPRI